MVVLSDYERQPWRIRACRWLRHKPIAIAKGSVVVLWWLLRGLPRFDELTTGQTLEVIWYGSQAKAELLMGACIPLSDLIDELKDETDCRPTDRDT